MHKISTIFWLLLTVELNRADISHLLTPEYAIFPQHPFHFGFQQPFQPPQQQQGLLPALYGPPPDNQPAAGYPNPATPAPVAPTQTATTTEFFLPEIVENRSAKDQINFIPIRNHYLPPDVDERPNYESPKPPDQGSSEHHHNHQDHHQGYYYPHPIASTTTTTDRPSPIVVVEPNDPSPPFHGYDYNAPPPAPSRPSTPAPVYLPPPAVVASSGFGNEEAGVVSHTDASNPLRVRIKEMRCMQSLLGGGFFRAVLKVESFLAATPNVDNDSIDKRCELRLARGNVYVDISAEDFAKCGVRSCGKDLCLRLRFPAIRGMRTGNDAILTLNCKSQERIAVKTHALKVGVANDVQARSIGTYAQGGSQNAFRTHIELLRRSRNGAFSRHLESNGAVQLGEDLLLRAHVLPGDGWNFTKLTDVSLQRISPNGELLNTANLVTTRGCINPSMSSICNQAPIYDPPLGHKLNFKAVMFQGMHSGDELVMSMRITGCLEQHDCHVSQQECNSNQFSSIGRRRRDTALEAQNQTNHIEISEISRISFRVIMDNFEMYDAENFTVNGIDEPSVITFNPKSLIIASCVGFVLLLMCLGAIIAWKLNN